MRFRTLFAASLALLFLIASSVQATDYTGEYQAPKISLKLKLDAASGSYSGDLTVAGNKYPVTAKEDGGALQGTFVSQGTKFDFSAKLEGTQLSFHSGNHLYELQREGQAAPANPFDQLGPGNNGPTTTFSTPTNPAQQAANPGNQSAIDALKDLGQVHTDPSREWLIIVYMDGDNSLAEDSPFNIKQMEKGLPESGMDVLVLWDCPMNTKENPNRHPTLRHVKRSEHDDVLDSDVLKDFGMLDMSDPHLLSAFIEGAVKAYPAKHHAIYTWDHGGGWANLNDDDHAPGKSANDAFMNIMTLRAGLVDGMRAAGLKKWDFIGFDMCLMCQLETAAELHDLADVMVASEELVPGKGMPYTAVVKAFAKSNDPRAIGKEIVREFDNFHREDSQRSTTLAALDLSEFDELNSKLNALCDGMIPFMSTGWSDVARSYFYAEQYNDSHEDFKRGKHARQSIDLIDSLKKIRNSMHGWPEGDYQAFMHEVQKFVLADANSQRRRLSNGIAIYAPVVKDAFDPAYQQTALYKVSHWPKLLQSLYPEQARHRQVPVFSKVELVDAVNNPVSALVPLTNCATTFEVTGTNLAWIRHMAAVRDPQAGGARILFKDYIIDDDYLNKVAKINEFGQDTDVIMPLLVDGVNKLREPQLGMAFLMTNGQTTLPILLDNSKLNEPTKFTVPVLVEDPRIGSQPANGTLECNAVTMSVEDIVVETQEANGHSAEAYLPPKPETRITPRFEIFKDDGTESWTTGGSMPWRKGVNFTMDIQRAGDYEDIMLAETMTGATGVKRFKYALQDNPVFNNAKATWKRYRPDMIPGTWTWLDLGNPPTPTGRVMTLAPTKEPGTFTVSVEDTGKDGKKVTQTGLLYLETGEQPLFRLMVKAEMRQVGVLMGPMWWTPGKDGVSQIMTYQLAMKKPMLWRRTGGKKQITAPDGWNVFVDSSQTISLATPPDFVVHDETLKNLQKVYDHAETYLFDFKDFSAVAVTRFDGVFDPDTVIKTILDTSRTAGAIIQFQDPEKMVVNGAEDTVYRGGVTDPNGIPTQLVEHMFKTKQGIIVVCFGVVPYKQPIMVRTFERIRDSIHIDDK